LRHRRYCQTWEKAKMPTKATPRVNNVLATGRETEISTTFVCREAKNGKPEFHHRADFANNSRMVTHRKKATSAKDTEDTEKDQPQMNTDLRG